MTKDEDNARERLEKKVLDALKVLVFPNNCPRGGKLYFLGKVSYATLFYDNGFNIQQPFEDEQYESGIDRFVETSLSDPECIGFVPISEGVENELLQRLKLKPLFDEDDKTIFRICR